MMARRLKLLVKHGYRAVLNDMRPLPRLDLHLRTAPSVDGLFAFEVPLDKCRNIIQQRYDVDENVFVACARELLASNPEGARRAVQAYYFGFQPENLYDCFYHSRSAVPVGEVRAKRLPPSFIIPPWDAMRRRDRERLQTKGAVHPLIGPQSDAKVDFHLERYQAVCDSIGQNGYQPELFGFIQGHVLDNGDDAVFVVTSGKHRIAVLAAMGVARIPVCFKRNMPRCFSRSQSCYWPNVVNGMFTHAEAEAIFDGFFV